MRFRRKLPVWLGFLIIVAAVWAVVFLRRHAPPEPARLLPTADGFVYVDLKWMRYTDVAKKLPAVAHDPDYEKFIQATGFQFEHDLQEAALAIHYASPENGGETRFSEVVVAKIDGDRLRTYLAKLSPLIETYRAIDIYNIPIENRILRVAILGSDTVAASNVNDPGVIRGIIDRSRKLASPFGGPALLRQSYKHVPSDQPGVGDFQAEFRTAQRRLRWDCRFPVRQPRWFRCDTCRWFVKSTCAAKPLPRTRTRQRNSPSR